MEMLFLRSRDPVWFAIPCHHLADRHLNDRSSHTG